MGTFFLQAGLVIYRLGQTLEYVSRTSDELYFEEPETGKRITLTEANFWAEFQTQRITIADAFSSPKVLLTPDLPKKNSFRNLADLPKHHQDELERRIAYIKRLRAAGITRGQTFLITDMVRRIANEIGDENAPGTSTIQRWWRKLENYNLDFSVIINANALRQCRHRIDDDSEQFLQEQIDKKFLIDTRPTAIGAYREYLGNLKTENRTRAANGAKPLLKVALRTFYARIDKLPKKNVMEFRYGREAARHHFKMIKGHMPADHPLDSVEIDHTPMNLYAIDDMAFLPLGRPWLTAIKDRYSGVLLGFFVTFQITGLNSIFGAIKHSLCSHHMAYELWPDIENPWPAHGRGHRYVSDRGADFLSPRYRMAITSLGAYYEYCERRTPWLKGSIERFFLTLEQTFFEAMPGRTFASLRIRGDYDPAKDAVIRFSTLIYLLHKWCADFHNILPNKRKQARPLDLWLDGIGIAPPPYPSNVDELNIILGEHNTGTLSQEGIRYKWLTYANEELSDLMKLVGRGGSVDFVVSLENLGYVHVRHPQTNQFIRVSCTRPEYASGLTSFQHQYLRKQAGKGLKNGIAIDTLIESRLRVRDAIMAEVDAKSTKAKSQIARIAGINSNAVLSQSQKSILTPFADQNLTGSVAPEPNSITSPFTNVPMYQWGT